MSTKDLIEASYTKNALEFKEAFNNEMTTRVESMIALKFESMFESNEDGDAESKQIVKNRRKGIFRATDKLSK